MHDLFVEDTEIYLQHVNKEHTRLEPSVSFWKSIARFLDERAISDNTLINNRGVNAVCTMAATRKLISNQIN